MLRGEGSINIRKAVTEVIVEGTFITHIMIMLEHHDSPAGTTESSGLRGR
jgi:hypothetical protein